MKKEYTFNSVQSGKALIIIDDDKITIKRKGLLSLNAHGLTGEKTFRIDQISAVQLKETGIAIGYIQFVLKGSQESKGGLQAAMKDENTVCFDGGWDRKKVNSAAREIKEYIDEYMSKLSKNNNPKSNLDEIKKLKELLDMGAINQEEFDKKKKELLEL